MPVSDAELQGYADEVVEAETQREALSEAMVALRESLADSYDRVENAAAAYRGALTVWATDGSPVPDGERKPEPVWSEVYAEAAAAFAEPEPKPRKPRAKKEDA